VSFNRILFVSGFYPTNGRMSNDFREISNGSQKYWQLPLQNLTNLQTLDLKGTQVSDVTPLQNLTNLQFLAVSLGDIKGLQGFKKGIVHVDRWCAAAQRLRPPAARPEGGV